MGIATDRSTPALHTADIPNRKSGSGYFLTIRPFDIAELWKKHIVSVDTKLSFILK